MTEYLELDDLIVAATATLGRPPEVRDVGLLEGAAARPRASAYGVDAYPDLDTKAAALLHSIITGHALAEIVEQRAQQQQFRTPARASDDTVEAAVA